MKRKHPGSGRLKILVLIGCFISGLLDHMGVPASIHGPQGVGALASLSNGQIVLLDQGGGFFQEGGLFLVDPPPAGTMRRLANFAPFYAIDLTVFSAEGGQDQIFVTSANTLRPTFFLRRLERFKLVGDGSDRYIRWPSNGGLSLWAGVAINQDGKTAYIATSQREILKAYIGTTSNEKDGKAKSATRFELLQKVQRADTLGPMVFDAKRRRLLVADPIQGTIFSVEVGRSDSSILVKQVGEPYALALDAVADRLYVADAEGGQVLAVDLADSAPEAKVFTHIIGMEQPHGLAIGRNGSLWVGGHGTLTLYHVSNSGALLETFRPKLIP
jgi:DNA-binding beta-propeller fold protein YncE